MGVGEWYRGGSKLAFNLHRKITSCNVVVNSSRNQIPRTNHPLFHNVSSPKCYYVTYPSCSAIQIRYGIRKDHRLSSPFVIGVARRYYCATHSPGGGNWRLVLDQLFTVLDLFRVTTLILTGSALTIDLFRRIETVPFTNRTRLISWSHSFDKYGGQISIEYRKELYEGKTLPATHPKSVRVTLIAENIVNGLQSVSISGKDDDEKKANWIDVSYASDIPESVKDPSDMSFFEKLMMSTSLGNDFLSNKDIDVKWVQNCRKKGKWKKPTTNHLKAYNWEILLVKDCSDHVTATSLSGGKIVVSSEFLEHFRSDDEIAVILGHEVAHILAQHIAEEMTTYSWVERTICFLFGLGVYNFDKAGNESQAFLKEAEADYIGLLLMASAGYDPRVAPGVYKKLDGISGIDPGDPRYVFLTGEKRARLLAKPKVMEEALLMYHDATTGRGD